MQFKIEKDTYLVIGYPSVSKPFNLRISAYTRLSSAATVWERIQKPAAIYLIKKDKPNEPKLLVNKQKFNCVLDVVASKDGTQVSVDVCSMTSLTEPKLSFTIAGEIVATPHVTIQGVPVASYYFNRFDDAKINVDEAIHTGLNYYNNTLDERIETHERLLGLQHGSHRAIINLLVEIAMEDNLSLYKIGK